MFKTKFIIHSWWLRQKSNDVSWIILIHYGNIYTCLFLQIKEILIAWYISYFSTLLDSVTFFCKFSNSRLTQKNLPLWKRHLISEMGRTVNSSLSANCFKILFCKPLIRPFYTQSVQDCASNILDPLTMAIVAILFHFLNITFSLLIFVDRLAVGGFRVG